MEKTTWVCRRFRGQKGMLKKEGASKEKVYISIGHRTKATF